MALSIFTNPSQSEVALASIFVESILYGLFASLFITSTPILVERLRNSGGKSNKFLIVVSILMFVLGTIHICVSFLRVFDGFIKHGGSEEESQLYFGGALTALYVIKDVVYVLQTLVGDGFILYRLYLVWNGDKRVVLPLLVCFIASIGTGIGGFPILPKGAPKARQIRQWVKAFLSLTFSTNLISTSLISSRIWWAHSKMIGDHVDGRGLAPAAMIIIESGAIYLACLIILFGLDIASSVVEAMLIDLITQVIGIVFSLVIVRVASGKSSEMVMTQGNISTFTPRHMEETRSIPTVAPTDSMMYSLKSLTTSTDMTKDVPNLQIGNQV